MTASDIATVLHKLARLRDAEGKTERGRLIAATAIHVRELTDDELYLLGLTSSVPA